MSGLEPNDENTYLVQRIQSARTSEAAMARLHTQVLEHWVEQGGQPGEPFDAYFATAEFEADRLLRIEEARTAYRLQVRGAISAVDDVRVAVLALQDLYDTGLMGAEEEVVTAGLAAARLALYGLLGVAPDSGILRLGEA